MKKVCDYCDEEKVMVKYMGDQMCAECRDETKRTEKLMSAHLREVKKVYGKEFNIGCVNEALPYIAARSEKNKMRSVLGNNIVTTTERDGVYSHSHKKEGI